MRHQLTLLIEFLKNLLHLLQFWMHCWVYWVNMELKLICLIKKAINTSLRNVSNNALIMIRMMTMEVFWFFTFHDSKFTRSACLFTSEARNSVKIILSKESLISFFDHTFSYEHDVDWMGKISENCNESFCHFSSHVEILILVLEKINGMWNLAIGSKMFHDLAINKEEDFNLIFWKISVNIFVVQLYGSIKERLPSLLWFCHFTNFNWMIKDLLDFNIMSHFVIKVDFILIKSFSQNRVNSFHRDFNCLNRGSRLFIKIL